jgi:hypothetical protein
MAEQAIRSLRPDRVVFDAGSTHWRGAVLIGIDGDTATLRVRAEASLWKTLTCAASLLPAGVEKGHPLAVRVTNTATHTIAAVIGTTWPGRSGPVDEAAAVDAALAGLAPWYAGAVPRSITHEPETWWVS